MECAFFFNAHCSLSLLKCFHDAHFLFLVVKGEATFMMVQLPVSRTPTPTTLGGWVKPPGVLKKFPAPKLAFRLEQVHLAGQTPRGGEGGRHSRCFATASKQPPKSSMPACMDPGRRRAGSLPASRPLVGPSCVVCDPHRQRAFPLAEGLPLPSPESRFVSDWRNSDLVPIF